MGTDPSAYTCEHFYDVHRMEFDFEVTVETHNSCQCVDAGGRHNITREDRRWYTLDFHYAETFVIPAAAKSYTMINNGKGRAKVVKAFIKDSIDHLNN